MKLKTVIKLVSFFIIFAAVLSLAVPFITKSQLKQWMLEQGAEQARIDRLYLNIWTGRLELEGLTASAANRPELRIGHLSSELSYRSLWNRRLQLLGLQLNNSTIPLFQQPQGWQVGPLQLAAASDTDTQDSSSGWYWGLNELQISDLALNARLEGQDYRLKIDQSRLRLLYNWLPDSESFLVLKGSLNGSPFNFNSQGTPFAKRSTGRLDLKLDQLSLQPMLKPWLPELKGELSTDLQLQITQTDTGLILGQKGKLQLNGLRYATEPMTLNSQQIGWQGDIEVELADNRLKQVNSSGQLKLQQTELQQGEQKTNVAAITWQGAQQLEVQAQSAMTVALDGALELLKLKLAQPQQTLTSERLHWKGNNTLSLLEQIPQRLVTNGEFELADFGLEQAELQLQAKRLHWQGENQLELEDSEPGQLAHQGQLQIDQLRLKQPSLQLTESAIHWQGAIAGPLQQQLKVEGSLTTDHSELQLGTRLVKNEQRQWQGSATLDLQGGQLSGLEGQASIKKIVVDHTALGTLLAVDQLTAEGLSAQPSNLFGINQLQADNIEISHKAPLLSLSQLRSSGLRFSPEAAHVELLELATLKSKLELNQQQQPQAWLDWQAALMPPASQEDGPQQSADDTTPFHFSLKRLQLNSPAQIVVNDHSIEASDIDIEIQTLVLSGIDTQNTKPTPFELKSKINRFGELALSGHFSWLAPTPSGDWKGSLSNLELPPFSPYMQRHSGYQIKSGQFNIEAQGNISEGQVESNNDIRIHNLDVSQTRPEDATEFDQELGMPLNTALSILTDDDNNVRLQVPVTGDIDDPSFGYQSVVKIIMSKVAKEGAITYLSNALQPYGTLISLGRWVASSAKKNAINLNPVNFDAGSAELSAQASEYLGKIGALLKEKEGIRLKLCGYSVMQDKQALIEQHQQQLEAQAKLTKKEETGKAAQEKPAVSPLTDTALDEALRSLAEQRSVNVKQQLLDVGKVAPERLFSCLPEVNLKEELSPQVSLGL